MHPSLLPRPSSYFYFFFFPSLCPILITHHKPHNYDPLSSSHLTLSLHFFVFPFSLHFFPSSSTHPLHLTLPPPLILLPSIPSLSHHPSGKSVRLSGGEEGRVEWEGTVWMVVGIGVGREEERVGEGLNGRGMNRWLNCNCICMIVFLLASVGLSVCVHFIICLSVCISLTSCSLFFCFSACLSGK